MRWFNRRHKKKSEDWIKIQSKLKVADIILLREKGDFISSVIRRFTKSYWSHAALVFVVPDKKFLFNNYLIIESNQSGLEIHRIQKYTKYLNRFDIAVKRVPGLDKKIREKVVAFMLNNLDQKYDVARILAFFLKSFDLDLTKGLAPLFVNKEDFVCSTFIQKAFLDAFREKKKLVDFSSEDEDDIEYLTPKDIAKSKNCKWIYNKHY
jgi:hypothetical protein